MRQATKAARTAETSLATVEGLMSFAQDSRGNRIKKERPLYTAAITFLYAAWESYIEDLAIEITTELAQGIDAECVPEAVRDRIEKQSTTWQLAVSPGWRILWIDIVTRKAKGDGKESFGVNTAGPGQVKAMFELVGVDSPLPSSLEAPEESGSHTSPSIPREVHVSDGTIDAHAALSLLIKLRGEVVHGAATQTTIYKHQVLWWDRFVKKLIEVADLSARLSLNRLLQESAEVRLRRLPS